MKNKAVEINPNSMILNCLSLHIGDQCNLSCKYCYGHSTSSGTSEVRQAAGLSATKKSIESLFLHFREIRRIQFIGGEPALRVPILEDLCKSIGDVCCKYHLKPPKFTLITNGTLVTQRFIDLIRDYRIGVTLSLDGPPKINDALRVFRDGSGSTKTIIKNALKLKEETNQPTAVEGTYTRLHILSEVSVLDIMRYVKSTLGVSRLHLPIVSAVPTNSLSIPIDFVDYLCNTYRAGISCSMESLTEPDVDVSDTAVLSFACRIIKGYVSGNRPPRTICPAGTHTIVLNLQGDIFPCPMFVGLSEFRICSALDDRFADALAEARDRYSSELRPTSAAIDLKHRLLHMVGGCAGFNLFATGDISLMPRIAAVWQEAMVSQAMSEIAFLETQPELWGQLLVNLVMLELNGLAV